MAQWCNVFEEYFGDRPSKNVCLDIGSHGPEILKKVSNVMKESTLHHFNSSNPRNEEILQYGCTAGNTALKKEIAKYLTCRFRNSVSSEDLFISTGASQMFATLLQHYFEEGDTLFVEDLTYWIILQHLEKNFKLNVVSIPMDEKGMKVDDLEKYLETSQGRQVTERRPYRFAVYTIPVHHNPTGICLSQERCRKLVEIARKHNILVIADDVYNAMTYSAPDEEIIGSCKPPTRLLYYDKKSDSDYKGNVVSISSFSKLMAPGLRLGWCEMPPHMLELFKTNFVTESGGGWNPYTGGIVTAGLRAGIIQKHIEEICSLYKKRSRTIIDIISDEVGELGVNCNKPDGGIFLWITLPIEMSATELLTMCQDRINFVTGNRCSHSGSYSNCFRVAIGFYEEKVLYSAIYEICGLIKEYKKRLDK